MLGITLNHFFVLSFILFIIGVIGVVFNRKNIVSILLSFEIIFISANLNFVASSVFFDKIDSQLYCLFSLSLLAVELSIGLSILYLLFTKNKISNVEKL